MNRTNPLPHSTANQGQWKPVSLGARNATVRIAANPTSGMPSCHFRMAEIGPYGRPNAYSLSYDPTYTIPLATTGERPTDPLVELAHKGEQGWKQDAGKAYKVP